MRCRDDFQFSHPVESAWDWSSQRCCKSSTWESMDDGFMPSMAFSLLSVCSVCGGCWRRIKSPPRLFRPSARKRGLEIRPHLISDKGAWNTDHHLRLAFSS